MCSPLYRIVDHVEPDATEPDARPVGAHDEGEVRDVIVGHHGAAADQRGRVAAADTDRRTAATVHCVARNGAVSAGE